MRWRELAAKEGGKVVGGEVPPVGDLNAARNHAALEVRPHSCWGESEDLGDPLGGKNRTVCEGGRRHALHITESVTSMQAFKRGRVFLWGTRYNGRQMANYVELGPALKAAREKRGLTQVEAGALFGVTSAAWNRWEAGVADPQPDREIYRMLRDFLELSPSKFNELMLETRFRVKERRAI